MGTIKKATKRKDKPTARALARSTSKVTAKPARERASKTKLSLKEITDQINTVPATLRLKRARDNAMKLIGREML